MLNVLTRTMCIESHPYSNLRNRYIFMGPTDSETKKTIFLEVLVDVGCFLYAFNLIKEVFGAA